jgi:hypothetical protein
MDGTGKLSDLEYMKPLAEYEASADLEGIAVEPTEHKTVCLFFPIMCNF